MTINPYAVAPAQSEPPLVAEVVDDQAAGTLDFTLHLEDALRWNAYFRKHSPAMRRQFYTAWVAVGILLLLAVWLGPRLLLPNPPLDGPFTATMLVVAAGLWGAYPWLHRWRIERAIRAIYLHGGGQTYFGPRRIAITPQYAIYSTPLIQSIARWSAVQQVVVERGDVFIILSPIQAFVVPAHAFASDDQRERFVKAAEGFRRQVAVVA